MKIFKEAVEGIEHYFNFLKYLYHLASFYLFKIIFNSGVLISILSSSFILAMFFDGNINFLKVYADNMHLDFKGLLPYLILSFILLISYEIARYHFKAIYFTGVEVEKKREKKGHFFKRMIGFWGVILMTAVLILGVYLANSIIGDRISKKLNNEIMSSYNSNAEVIKNNKAIAIYERKSIYASKIIKIKISNYLGDKKKLSNKKKKARQSLNIYKMKIRKLKTFNNKILSNIIKNKKDVFKSKRNGAFYLSVAIEFFSIMSFLMDILVFKNSDVSTKVNIKAKYRAMNNKLIKSNILPPKLIRKKPVEKEKRVCQNPFLS